MSDSDDDEDLKRAIALSLEESPPPGIKQQSVIDLVTDSEDEDDDLNAPVAIRNKPLARNSSLIQNDPKPTRVSKTILEIKNVSSSTPSQANGQPLAKSEIPSSTLGFLGMDRKQMEEERLARLKNLTKKENIPEENSSQKRKASNSLSCDQEQDGRQVKQKLLSSFLPGLLGGRKTFESCETARTEKANSIPIRGTSVKDQPRPISEVSTQSSAKFLDPLSSKDYQPALFGLQYPEGMVKKTWARGYPRQGDDIKIEEVLQKNDLELAILSGFQIDPEWIQSKLVDNTKVIWVLQAKTEAEKQNWRSGAASNFRFCFPSMEGNVNCMHSKLQLLAHPTYLRVVVPTANLVPYDWGETGVMENTLFLIDLPRLSDGQLLDPENITPFGQELLHFASAMELPPRIVDSLRKFDFSRTGHLAFVHSIGGSHSGSAWRRTGYCGLGTAIRQLGLDTKQSLDIDFLTASVGSINREFLRCLYLAAQGDDGYTEYKERTTKPTKKKSKPAVDQKTKIPDDLETHCRVYFPTHETVAKSRGGVDAGGTICFQPRWYDSETFPRSLMRDSKSQREGMLMHSKMWFARTVNSEMQDSSVAWAYLGSANLTESAWGKLVQDRTTKEPKLNIKNWECGVILQIPRTLQPQKGSSSGIEVFNGHVPVPMVVPGEKYGSRRPWFFSKS